MNILLCILLAHLIFGLAYARKFEVLRDFACCHLLTIVVFVMAILPTEQNVESGIIFCAFIITVLNVYLVIKHSKKRK